MAWVGSFCLEASSAVSQGITMAIMETVGFYEVTQGQGERTAEAQD